MRFQICLFGALLSAVAPRVLAQAAVYEPFTLGVGSPFSSYTTPGTGIASWSTASSSVYGATGLAYGGLEASGNAIAFTSGDTQVTAALSGSIAPSTSSTVYLSALVEVYSPSGANDYGGIVFAGAFTGFDRTGTLGAVASGASLNGTDSLHETLAIGQTYLLVDQFNLTNLGGGNFSVTVSTSVGLDGGVDGNLAELGSFTTSTNDPGAFGQIVLESDYSVKWDELRVGSSLADVTPGLSAQRVPVPEAKPYATAAALAALGVAALRRRRSPARAC